MRLLFVLAWLVGCGGSSPPAGAWPTEPPAAEEPAPPPAASQAEPVPQGASASVTLGAGQTVDLDGMRIEYVDDLYAETETGCIHHIRLRVARGGPPERRGVIAGEAIELYGRSYVVSAEGDGIRIERR